MPEPIPMTDDERYFFDLYGYLVRDDVLTPDEVAHLNAVIDAQNLPPAGEMIESQRFGGFFAWDPRFLALLNHPGVLAVLKEMIGDRLRIDHAYGIVMAPGTAGGVLHGGGTPYDPAQYYVHRNGRMYNGLTVVSWALVDAPPGAGGFCCVPGSHKANYPIPGEVRNFRSHADWVKPVPQRAGSVVFFTEALTHGTLPWTAPYDRRSILLKYSPGHAAWGRGMMLSEEVRTGLDEEQQRLFEPPYVWQRERV